MKAITILAVSLILTVTVGVNLVFANLGDVDLNGDIEISDAELVLKKVRNADFKLSEQQLKAADVYGNGSITASNAALIHLKAIDNDFLFPVEREADTSDGVVVTDYDGLKKAIDNKEKKVYIKGKISCKGGFSLTQKNAQTEFIGIESEDGTAAVLDFDYLLKQTSSWTTGITVSGSGYKFKNLIVENASDCGLRIKGNGAGNCVVENCVFRYNQNSGVSVTEGGANNEFIACDSYRNGDIVKKYGDDADGFSVKLAAGANNRFYNCRAWENSDDGWDSYDRGEPVGAVYYEECLAWNNGNPDVFTGEYDYKNGFPLDKKLLYVQEILKNDKDFEDKYNSDSLAQWPRVTISIPGGKRSYDEIHSFLWGGNPNGFKFGSADTPKTSYRFVKNCIAFDHHANKNQENAKGFDQNNGYAGYDLVNALSFNNVQNYWMDRMTLLSVSGSIKGFNVNQSYTMEDAPSVGLDIITPDESEQKRLAKTVYEYRDMIYSYVYNDKIPGEKLCDVF